MTIHVRTWQHSPNATITDMADAWKRGKRCRQIRWTGCAPPFAPDAAGEGWQRVWALFRWLESLPESADFDAVAAELRARMAADGLPESRSAAYWDESIRAIDAPRPKLVAGVEGKWSASANESGVTVNEDADSYNLPCCITHHGQKDSAAYRIAAKVWDAVKACRTFSEAVDTLRAAGWRSHYYCRMD